MAKEFQYPTRKKKKSHLIVDFQARKHGVLILDVDGDNVIHEGVVLVAFPGR